MKLGLMQGETVPAREWRELGFHAVQMFFGHGADGEAKDPSPDALDAVLGEGDVALAAMTLHVDLVNGRGCVDRDVARAVQCVEKTAALDGRFGDNARPILIWHPSAYPAGDDVDDTAVFEGLCQALGRICATAEEVHVDLAVEITRAGSVGSAETFLHLHERVGSSAFKACIDAANFVPDRTPLERAMRRLGPHTVIAHGKDASFKPNGEVEKYGPTGTGQLDYAAYLRMLQAHTKPAYFVLEYYRSREDLLRARDIVLPALAS